MKKKTYQAVGMILAGVLSVLPAAPVSQAAAKKPGLSKTKVNLTEGESRKLSLKNCKGYTVSWKSSCTSVASVTKTGKIKAKKEGKAKITATLRKSKKASACRLVCNVSVGKALQGGAEPYETASSETVPAVTEQPRTKPYEAAPSETVPVVTEQPLTKPPAGSEIQTGDAQVLFSKKNKAFSRELFGDRLITSYEQFQEMLQEAEKAAGHYSEWYCSLPWIIDRLKKIDSDYFISNVLCVNTVYLTTGYEFAFASASVTDEGQGTKTLKIYLDKNWAVPPDQCVTDDMAYYSCFTQIPRETAQGCSRVVYELTERGFEKEHQILFPVQEPSVSIQPDATRRPVSTWGPAVTQRPAGTQPSVPQPVRLETELPDENTIPGLASVYRSCCPKLENRVVADVETLQEIIDDLKNGEEAFMDQELIQKLESYGKDFFEENSLVLGCHEQTNGYLCSIRSLTVKKDQAGSRILNCNLEDVWNVPEGCCVTCEMIFHHFIIEVSSDLVYSDDQVKENPIIVKPD